MTTEPKTDNGTKRTTRRSRKANDQVPAVLARVIAELDKIDDAGRDRVLRSVAAYYGKGKGLYYPPGVRGDDGGQPRTRGAGGEG